MTRATSSIAVLAAALATFGSADKGAAEGFAGLSVGAFVEHAWNGISFAEQMVAPPPPPPEEFGSGNLNGFGAGLLIGYDVMVSTNLLVGVVADVAVGDWEADYNVSPTLVGYYDVTYAGTIRGRIGYLFTPAMMGYVTGGYALANVRHGGRQAPTPTSISYQADGWTFGAGGEMQVGSTTTLFLEYLHTDYSSGEFVLHNEVHNVDLDSDTVRLGVRFRN